MTDDPRQQQARATLIITLVIVYAVTIALWTTYEAAGSVPVARQTIAAIEQRGYVPSLALAF